VTEISGLPDQFLSPMVEPAEFADLTRLDEEAENSFRVESTDFFGFPAIESESLRSLKSVFSVAGCGQAIHVIRMDDCAIFDWFFV